MPPAGAFMPEIHAWTDGACSGNPGPGGWGVLMRAVEGDAILKERELSGGEAETTNNRMELMAAIMALEALTRPTRITLTTDSAYVKNGVEAGSTAGRRTAGARPGASR
jgi:ribonuclease HI